MSGFSASNLKKEHSMILSVLKIHFSVNKEQLFFWALALLTEEFLAGRFDKERGQELDDKLTEMAYAIIKKSQEAEKEDH